MAEIRPFSALRPPADLVERVACPPYDVVSTAQARAMAAGNPDSFLHVTRPEIDLPEGTDEYSDAVYEAGRRNLLAIIERKLLERDAEPQLYLYAQQMGEHRQIGVVACASVAEYIDDLIKKHEKTRPDKENDRTRHIEVLQAHDEPVFLTYQARPLIDELVQSASGEVAASYDFVTADGVRHQLWVLDASRTAALVAAFSDVPSLYVADGHHRSAAAARVHQKLVGNGQEHDAFLVVLFPHDQMNIMPYNRVVKDRLGRSPKELIARLGEAMDINMSERPEPEETGTFGVYVDGAWYRARARQELIDRSNPVSALDCSICQDQILGPIFDITDPRRDKSIDFVGGIHGAAELERRVDSGEASIAFLLYPTKMEEVMAVSDAGEVMPPKSTWFEPKLRSGLFVHTF